MKDQATNVLKSIQQFWKSQEKKRKIIFLSVLGGIILFAVILTLILNRTNYTVLFSSLEQSEASEVVSIIKDMGVDAQVKSDGTILVPKDQENSLRVELATKGYPKSGYSYDIWTNNVSMFTTDSQKREIAKMQLQERLQATISEFQGIDKAIVTLDIPEQSNTVISSHSNEPSASVVVHLKDGVKLSSNQISGITRLVMKSISGLKEENVSVVDQNANLLIASDDDGNSDALLVETKRLQFKNAFEAQLENAAKNLLVKAYGKDNVEVSVNATFNYDKKVSEDTKYTPSVGDSGMVEHEDSSSAWGNDSTTGGVVGVESNADGTYPTEDSKAGSGASWGESSKSTSYLVNTLKEQTEKNGVYVEKVMVSVVLYKDTLTEDEQLKVLSTVANATGTKPEFVSVQNLPALGSTPGEIPTITENFIFGLSMQEFIIYAVAIIALLFIILLTVAILIRKSKKKKAKMLAMATASETQAETEPIEPIDIKKLSDAQPDTKEAMIRREIGDFAKNSPEIAAQLLKSWLREDGV